MGLLDNYPDVLVRIDGNDKGVMPRNWLTVGTTGSGKSNTTQVFTEETLQAGYAQVIIDPEGEYIMMDKPTDENVDLQPYQRNRQGVSNLTVYRPPNAASKREDAIQFSVPFDSLNPDVIVELAEMNSAQQTRFTFLYDQAIQLLRKKQEKEGKESGVASNLDTDDWDLTRGYPGIKLRSLIEMLNQELRYYNWKRDNKNSNKGKSKKDEEADESSKVEGMKIYCHHHQLEPLIQDQHDASSYGALGKKLRELQMLEIFDRTDAPSLDMEKLSEPRHLSIIDMSDANSQQVVNIVIADLLARMYGYKMKLTEDKNNQRKVFITIEEAHGFISRDKEDKMEQTLDQLRRIARRGRKRWLALHFVTQSPQHLPSELFELANNKIIHQTTGSENLRVLKAAAGSVNEAIWNDVPSLGRGRAVIVSSQYPNPIIVRIRPAASKRNYTA